jgi:FtsP/CotA-like multicopper oxidase with cupredoxin domain
MLLSTGSPKQLDAKTVSYDLTIAYEHVNFTGKEVRAMTINGTIPGPTLYMDEGDDVRIRVRNEMDVETSIHWHGILLPNRQDGVPYLTTPPILPGGTHVFKFPVIQSGTYWYHSHTGLQEQRGVYGSIVIYPNEDTIRPDREYVVVLSDWTDENPESVMRMLKRGTEFYALKKGSVQSLSGALKAKALKETLKNWLVRMPPMDVSDVAYDKFLINGRPQSTLDALPGETIRLRIINASASTYFYAQFAHLPMRLIAADGIDVEPVEVDRLLIAIAETYDAIVRIPAGGGAYEFRVTAQDGSGRASLFLGSGERITAPSVERPNLYKLHGGSHEGQHRADSDPKHGAHPKKEMDHKMPLHDEMSDMKAGMGERPSAPYAHLRSLTSTALDEERPTRRVVLEVSGDMERYVWSFNGKTLHESDEIRVRRGENVRIDFINKTMMHHPIHFHGHFFRVLNGHGDHAPLKHTVDIGPMETRSIEFHASEEKDWFLHCHILYHMDAGMARVVQYEGSRVDSDIAEFREWPSNLLSKDHWYSWADLYALSQMSEGEIVTVNTRNNLRLRGETGWEEREFEMDALYERYFSRFSTALLGVHITDEATRGVIGFRYTLPLLLESETWIDHEGEFRIEVDREIQLTSRLVGHSEIEYDSEHSWDWAVGGSWALSRGLSPAIRYHSDYGFGGGLSLQY